MLKRETFEMEHNFIENEFIILTKETLDVLL